MEYRRIQFIFFLVVIFLGSCLTNYASEKPLKMVAVSSPDKKIVFKLQNIEGKLSYQVNYQKNAVIENSDLGLNIDNKRLGLNSKILNVQKSVINETYSTRGVHSVAKNHCNVSKIDFSSPEFSFSIEVKVFNDGVAFRYLVNKKNSCIVDKDYTSFKIPKNSTVWSQHNFNAYEGKYVEKKIEAYKQNEHMGPPVTILLSDLKTYLAITEAGLTDFAGMSLIADGNCGFQAYLSGITKKDGIIESPWRVIEIGNNLNDLVNCDIIANVSPKYDKKLFPKGYDTEWIKPGRSVWSWFTGFGKSVTLENMKHFSDMAANLGFEYNLVDEGWATWGDGERDKWDMMKELVDYSEKKGVKIWVWMAYPNRKGVAGLKDEAEKIAVFKRCKAIGVAGLKIDFLDTEGQSVVNFYHKALRDAAKYHLLLDFHGANKPTGETRTYPNEMSREAIKGLENSPPWAQANTIFPFTRYLAGHADFTPMNFGNRIGEVSWAHHIASTAILYSPFLCLGADPQTIIDNPFKHIIMSIPPVWDETIVLPQSEIGKQVVYARRSGDKWFLAVLNGIHEKKAVNIDLSFLGKGKYKLHAIKDEVTRQDSGLPYDAEVNSKASLTINLNPEGGFLGIFEKTGR